MNELEMSYEEINAVEFGEEYYGFRWGSAVVERSGEYRMGKLKDGSRRMTKVISVIPDHAAAVEVHVSSSGKSVRVFRNGQELR